MANPRGQIVNTTYSEGRNVREQWTFLFACNERAWRQEMTVYTDEELVERMTKAFPDRDWSECLKQVKRARAAYNRGVWGELPVWNSCRYIRREGLVLRTTARGRILSQKRFQSGKGI